MYFRLLTSRLAKHGRQFLQSYWKRNIHTNILEQNQTKRRIPIDCVLRSGAFSAPANKASFIAPRSGILRFGQHARKLFIDNILKRCTTTYSEDLRIRATKKLFYGDSAPFFALIGVSLASGAGVLTKEDELEGVCWEIREASGRLQASWNHDHISETLKDLNLDKLDIGPAIAKGCAAVVYAAAFKDSEFMDDSSLPVDASAATRQTRISYQQQTFDPEMMSPIQNMSRFIYNLGGSVDNLNIYKQQISAATAFVEQYKQHQSPNYTNSSSQPNKTNFGFSGVGSGTRGMDLDCSKVNINRYPLALKMMFNYDIQSNALSILRAMYKETVPARKRHINEASGEWERLLQDHTLTLPPHPNIVCMFGYFCDDVRNLPDGHLLYPIAQPQRINPYGYGRNMSLYLLMKRYEYSLRKLLDSTELTTRTKLLLLTQLLEAVAHINRHGIAHRDIKSDNILIETCDDDSTPVLVLSDFGCCLADKMYGLQVPFSSLDIDRGGNAALMAPEIINKQPGPFSVLNYSKADLWACGAIAYEIFGLPNPFYSSNVNLPATTGVDISLRNINYKDGDLPPLGNECPGLVQKLIFNILTPNPTKRISPDVAANIMQLFLWAPSNWLKEGGMPNSPEILQWLLSLTTKVMCESIPSTVSVQLQTQKLSFTHAGRRTYVEYLLICSFLARVRLRGVRSALYWIQNV